MFRHLTSSIPISTTKFCRHTDSTQFVTQQHRFSTSSKMTDSKILIYLMRRDLRVADNPIFHAIRDGKEKDFTHLLPLYVFPAQQVEVSGFIPENSSVKSPYPEARSQIASFWRCGPHRAKFTAEAAWDVKKSLNDVDSDLCIRVGMVGEVVQEMLRRINERNDTTVAAVWMVGEETSEEKRDETDVKAACAEAGVACKVWVDEKYLIDDRDIPFEHAKDLPDVFTSYRKMVEPLREQPRPVLDAPSQGSLPPFPGNSVLPPQHSPFIIPDTLENLQEALSRPLLAPVIKNPPSYPKSAKSAHPFIGGESTARRRLEHLMASGAMTNYKDTRNGLLGEDFSSKLSAWLALGCVTARQIHSAMFDFENGTKPEWKDVEGYGAGLNPGTQAMRFELLWRDYMRLCARKFGSKLFAQGGFRRERLDRWNGTLAPKEGVSTDLSIQTMIERFLNGTTGMGLIDASQREVFHTGYTSNRARQNIASFFAKKLNIDWRIGAEWYECMLVDYDVASNWGNWQYLAGVGNDPRGEARIFNPVKQSFDYDPEGAYVKTWVPELQKEGLEPREIFQPWIVGIDRRRNLGLGGLVSVERPLVRIEFTVGKKGRGANGRGRGSSNNRGGVSPTFQNPPHSPNASNNYGYTPRTGRGFQANGNNGYGGRGYGSTTGHLRGRGGGPRWSGRGGYSHGPGGAGREGRSGPMDKEREMQAQDSMAT